MAALILAAVIRDGFYTVARPGGHRTFRIETQPDGAKFAPGKQIIAYRWGPLNEWQSFAFVIDGRLVPWKRFQQGYGGILEDARFLLTGDHTDAGKRYALESGNCYRCNRRLDTPESIAAGIGPVCAGRE